MTAVAPSLQADLGHDVGPDTDFLAFPELRQSVLDDVAIIKGSPLVAPGTEVRGVGCRRRELGAGRKRANWVGGADGDMSAYGQRRRAEQMDPRSARDGRASGLPCASGAAGARLHL